MYLHLVGAALKDLFFDSKQQKKPESYVSHNAASTLFTSPLQELFVIYKSQFAMLLFFLLV